ncbi:major facilitator superfamily domain-containing protein [Crucibulum laeve]|uniref:Major facilitator superfamily domain-containing protein n=1 Tax=Crucibulum laeve TaxID=68775 RepID=A0A5C3LS88_9AGAR|nr:major facilitator superfamily domain-containing protein [Crucibulum laeve]
MPLEESPLLRERCLEDERLYERFSSRSRLSLVFLMSWCDTLRLFESGTFVPSIPAIAKDLNTTGATIGIAAGLTVLADSLGSIVASTYATFYGRRPVYLYTLPLMVIGSIGISTAKSVPELLFWKVIQALGSSCVRVLGTAAIGDIYPLNNRGEAMGLFLGISYIGAIFASPLGGIGVHYVSWRVTQFVVGLLGLAAFLAMLCYFPETIHSRELDKYILNGGLIPSWRPILINPLRPLRLLRDPNILAACAAGSTFLLTNYVMTIPLAYTLGPRYKISSEFFIGICISLTSLGNMTSSLWMGHLADRVVTRWRAKRMGSWYPEDRLRACLLAFPYLPLSVLLAGITTTYISGVLGLAINLACLFGNGIALILSMNPIYTYQVDVLPDLRAETMAAYIGFRSIVISLGISAIIPMVNAYGVLFAYILTAIFTSMGFGIIMLTVHYGKETRGWTNTGQVREPEENIDTLTAL